MFVTHLVFNAYHNNYCGKHKHQFRILTFTKCTGNGNRISCRVSSINAAQSFTTELFMYTDATIYCG